MSCVSPYFRDIKLRKSRQLHANLPFNTNKIRLLVQGSYAVKYQNVQEIHILQHNKKPGNY